MKKKYFMYKKLYITLYILIITIHHNIYFLKQSILKLISLITFSYILPIICKWLYNKSINFIFSSMLYILKYM